MPTSPTRPVLFMFADTSKLGKEDTIGNVSARLITQSDFTHVELCFPDAPGLTYRVTERRNGIESVVGMVYNQKYYVAYECNLPHEKVQQMIDCCAELLESLKQYDKRGFWCYPCAVIAYYLFCGAWDPFVDTNKLTCTRMVGMAMREAGLWDIPESKLDILTCQDVMNQIKKMGAEQVDVPVFELNGIYSDGCANPFTTCFTTQ